MKFKMKQAAAFMLAAICAFGLTGCRIGNTEIVMWEKKLKSSVIFSLNDKECSYTEAKFYFANYHKVYGTSFGMELWGSEYNEEKLEQYIRDVSLSEIERVYVIVGMAEQQGIALSDEEKEKITALAKDYYDSMSKDEKNFTGVSSSNVKDYFLRYALADKMYQSMTVGVNEEVSDDEARVVEAQIFYVIDETKADIIDGKLTKSNFVTLATSYKQNATIDAFVARGDLPSAVEEELFNLDDGEISGKITTDTGYYFVKCINKFDEEKTIENVELIRVKKQKAQFNDLYDAFVEGAEFHLNTEKWDEMSLLNSDYKLDMTPFFGLIENSTK